MNEQATKAIEYVTCQCPNRASSLFYEIELETEAGETEGVNALIGLHPFSTEENMERVELAQDVSMP